MDQTGAGVQIFVGLWLGWSLGRIVERVLKIDNIHIKVAHAAINNY